MDTLYIFETLYQIEYYKCSLHFTLNKILQTVIWCSKRPLQCTSQLSWHSIGSWDIWVQSRPNTKNTWKNSFFLDTLYSLKNIYPFNLSLKDCSSGSFPESDKKADCWVILAEARLGGSFNFNVIHKLWIWLSWRWSWPGQFERQYHLMHYGNHRE